MALWLLVLCWSVWRAVPSLLMQVVVGDSAKVEVKVKVKVVLLELWA